MRLFVFGICLFFSLTALGQTAAMDSTIYEVAEEMPRFPACENLDTTIAFKAACAQRVLLRVVNQNINYPLEARELGAEGMVVVRFVVEKDGSLSYPEILKDVEGGCGMEVLRVIDGMNLSGIKWVPGIHQGDTVRTWYTLPVRFKLTEAPPYTMYEQDTIYTTLDTPLDYEGGLDSLLTHVKNVLNYPDVGNDSCLIGNIDVKLKVEPDGQVKVLDMVDLNKLGFDFWFEASNAITSTSNKWTPATYKNRKVPTSYDLSLFFTPEATHCADKIDQYQQAIVLADEGQKIFDEGDQEGGIAKMTAALTLLPEFPEHLFMRGQAYMAMNKFPEACADLTLGQNLADVTWFTNILPLICNNPGTDDEGN